MKYIENTELREWVKESLRATIFQKAHALAVQTGCEILVKLKDVTDIDTIHQSYATGSLQNAYNNNVLRKHSNEMCVSGVTGMPSMELAIQSSSNDGQELPESSASVNTGTSMVSVLQLQKESELHPTPSPQNSQTQSTASTHSNTQSTDTNQSSLNISQATEFHSTVETTEYGPHYAGDLPPEGDDAATPLRIKQEPLDEDEDIPMDSNDGAADMETKTESVSDNDLASMGEVDNTLDPPSLDVPPEDPVMPSTQYQYSGYQGASSSSDGLPSKPYQCAVCQKAFRSIQVLQKHTQTLHKRTQSRVYPRGSKSRGGGGGKLRGPYRAHADVRGHQVPQHVCTMCNQSFPESIILNDHIVKTHLSLDTSNPAAPLSVRPVPSQFSQSQDDPQMPQIASVSSLQFPQQINPSPASSSYSQSPMAPGPSHSAGGSSQERSSLPFSYTSGFEYKPQQLPTGNVEPRILQMSEPGKYLLGGNRLLVRDVYDYKLILAKAESQQKEETEKGRLLCMGLVRQEFSKNELATCNVTGVSRRASDKMMWISVPKLNPVLLESIFTQAQHQYPQFTDWYADKQCKTVKCLNDVCKKERQNAKIKEQMNTK